MSVPSYARPLHNKVMLQILAVFTLSNLPCSSGVPICFLHFFRRVFLVDFHFGSVHHVDNDLGRIPEESNNVPQAVKSINGGSGHICDGPSRTNLNIRSTTTDITPVHQKPTETNLFVIHHKHGRTGTCNPLNLCQMCE